MTTSSSQPDSRSAAAVDGEDDSPGEPPSPDSEPDPDPSHASCGVAIEVADTCEPAGQVDGEQLRRQLVKIAELAGTRQGELSLVLVGDTAMAELHEQHCGIPGTTDVLTFDLRPTESHPLDGEVVICVDEARRQAHAHGHDAALEALLYAVHGLLHLTGYDDQTPSKAARMHAREDELLTLAGLTPAYRAARSASDPND